MRELTKATPILGDVVYLGNASDVPLVALRPPQRAAASPALGSAPGARPVSALVQVPVKRQMSEGEIGEWEGAGWDGGREYAEDGEEEDPLDGSDNPMGYDICIECRDPAPLPTQDQLRAAAAHLASLDALWSARRFSQESEAVESCGASSSDCNLNPNPNSSPSLPSSLLSSSSSPPHSRSLLRAPRPAPSASHVVHLTFPASPPSFAYTMWHLTPFLNFLSELVAPRQHPPSTRPKRVLIYSSDGYTESSVLALCVLMKERGLDLPGAYLELQVEKGRSFFVYQSDIGLLKRVEAQLQKERATLSVQPSFRSSRSNVSSPSPSPSRGERHDWNRSWTGAGAQGHHYAYTRETGASHPYARSPRNSISYPTSGSAPGSNSVLGTQHEYAASSPPVVVPS
ncbi:hypothetical protein EW145_g8520, partial [Phellinidium pouzarii]